MVTEGRTTRVLLVEDHPVNQKVMTRMLERLECVVTLAPDGLIGLERARDHHALILMDCSMPVCDGFEATRRIRRLGGASAETPIVALTAHVGPGDRERCLAAGMDACLIKPVAPAQLIEVLRRYTSWQEPAAPLTEPALDEVTVAQLLALSTEDDDEFFPELVEEFERTAREALTDARGWHQREGYPELRRTMHRLRSSAATVGAVRLSEACQVLERAGDAQLRADGIYRIEAMNQDVALAVSALWSAREGGR